MQPTALPAQNAGAADMDMPALQAMDWMYKKEHIYLLAQFWQQVSRTADLMCLCVCACACVLRAHSD